jgi:hypothetical protein
MKEDETDEFGEAWRSDKALSSLLLPHRNCRS